MNKKIIFLLITIFFLVSCSKSQYEYNDAIITINDIVIDVDVASTEQEMMTGMMYREILGKNQGMFFVFAYDGVKTFWMKNCMVDLNDGGYGFFRYSFLNNDKIVYYGIVPDY